MNTGHAIDEDLETSISIDNWAKEPVGGDPVSRPAPLGVEAEDSAAPRLHPAVRVHASGLYRRRGVPGRPLFRAGELRLDVDGRYPQLTASGVVRSGLRRLHWIATLTSVGPRTWSGNIWYKDGPPVLLPHTHVRIAVGFGALGPRRARATFTGDTARVVHDYDFATPSFDKVEFEFDSTDDSHPATTIQTHDHPNRPATLASESLTAETVYERAGFDIRVSLQGTSIPVAGSGADAVWSDTEMHDAMQIYWSRFADKPQWALWVLHARMHEAGSGLGGIMFDDIGPNHRQGTAIFTDTFIANPPAGDPNPAAWIARMRFWTMCHEMGHAFNLAHSWQKSLGAPYGSPWLPLPDEPEARSFMNYPFSVAGGQTAFFSDFEFRFSDAELLFMRHAPRRFVQMGNAAWFDHHGFEEATVSPEARMRLEVRVNHDKAQLQFLEPAMIELKATNVSADPMVVEADLLEDSHHLTLVVKRGNQPARLWHPFATACHQPRMRVLAPQESIYQPIFVGAGRGGWLIDEPGLYTIQACLHLASGEDVVSAPLQLRIEPPGGFAESYLAQDVFTQDVARVLAFDGTRALDAAANALREACEQLPERRFAKHAKLALGLPLRRDGKLLDPKLDRAHGLAVVAGKPDDARALLSTALVQDSSAAAATLGHVEYRGYAEAYAAWLAAAGEVKEATKTIDKVCETLSARKVKPSVVKQVREFGELLAMGETPLPVPATTVGRV